MVPFDKNNKCLKQAIAVKASNTEVINLANEFELPDSLYMVQFSSKYQNMNNSLILFLTSLKKNKNLQKESFYIEMLKQLKFANIEIEKAKNNFNEYCKIKKLNGLMFK